MALALFSGFSATALEAMKQLVRSKFPKVRQLSTEELARWLADTNTPSPILLDVRKPEEFAVSHLPGAKRVEPSIKAADLIPTFPTNRTAVVYCSVGYRSGAFAKKLQDAGYTNVQNMAGSIFQWANEGYPVERDGKRVSKVHPYNGTWGKLLKPELRADMSAAGAGM